MEFDWLYSRLGYLTPIDYVVAPGVARRKNRESRELVTQGLSTLAVLMLRRIMDRLAATTTGCRRLAEWLHRLPMQII